MLRFNCNKFSRLASEGRDRELSAAEASFLSRHSSVCPYCEDIQSQASLAFADLAAGDLNMEPSPAFDSNVMAAFREGRRATGLGYWSPALMGAAIAGIALLCTLTIVTKTADSPVRRSPIGAAIRFSHEGTLPDLKLGTSIQPPQ